MSARRAAAALVASSVLAAGMAVATAAPAFAKSSIELRATPHSVVLGERVRLSAFGVSDDFGGDPMRLCVDERAGDGFWHVVGCGAEGAYRASVRASRLGDLDFRAQLLAVTRHGRLELDRTSATVTVRVN